MGYEVDFLAVGDGEQSGDAIALRFGNLHGQRKEQVVAVVDGGFQANGESLVQHIQQYYGTSVVDVVVSTHPDADHANGLRVVLEQLTVGALVMHLPWEHTDDIAQMFRDGRVTDKSVGDALRRSLECARGLETIAKSKDIKIIEPFADEVAWGEGAFRVVGPSRDYYESLLPGFRATPDPHSRGAFLEAMLRAATKIVNVVESWGVETLSDQGQTSAENNSSAQILFCPEAGHSLLLTGDAGIPAIEQAVDHLDRIGLDCSSLRLVQVPHHGSRHNVGPAVLNRLLGPIRGDDTKVRTAYVSAAKDAPKHPSKRVTNAFRRRGAYVYATQGVSLRHHHDAPVRDGWVRVEPMPFFEQFEEGEE